MDNVYPNAKEILPAHVRRRLPQDLVDDIETRYEELGPKYVGKNKYRDGRLVNQCMEKDSAQDALEEIVDAVFNVCVLGIKGHDIRQLLRDLVAIYNDLQKLKEK